MFSLLLSYVSHSSPSAHHSTALLERNRAAVSSCRWCAGLSVAAGVRVILHAGSMSVHLASTAVQSVGCSHSWCLCCYFCRLLSLFCLAAACTALTGGPVELKTLNGQLLQLPVAENTIITPNSELVLRNQVHVELAMARC